MATRSEQFRAQEQRQGDKPKAKATPKRNGNGGHVAKSANVVRESPSDDGKRSRKSSRGSAHHAKADSTVEHAAEMKKSSPKNQNAKSRARAKRVRGSA